jgi:hypothetical protein
MTCAFQSPRDAEGFHCSINRYGGKPHALACQQCIADGKNTVASKLPSALEMATGLVRSAAAWGKSGFKLADEETLASRMATCKACDLWDAAGMAGTGRCRKCGCSTQSKLRMASEKCPIGKW